MLVRNNLKYKFEFVVDIRIIIQKYKIQIQLTLSSNNMNFINQILEIKLNQMILLNEKKII